MSSKLSSLLVQDGVVSVKRMEEAFQRQVIFGGSLDTILLEMNVLDEAALQNYLWASSEVLPADFGAIDFAAAQELTQVFPQRLAEKYLIAPVIQLEGTLRVLVTDPPDPSRLDELGFMLGSSIEPRIVPEFRLFQALERIYGVKMPLRYAGLVKRMGEPPVPDRAAQAAEQATPLEQSSPAPQAAEQATPLEQSPPAPQAADHATALEQSSPAPQAADQATPLEQSSPAPQAADHATPTEQGSSWDDPFAGAKPDTLVGVPIVPTPSPSSAPMADTPTPAEPPPSTRQTAAGMPIREVGFPLPTEPTEAPSSSAPAEAPSTETPSFSAPEQGSPEQRTPRQEAPAELAPPDPEPNLREASEPPGVEATVGDFPTEGASLPQQDTASSAIGHLPMPAADTSMAPAPSPEPPSESLSSPQEEWPFDPTPLSFEDAVDLLQRCETRDDIFSILLRTIAGYFEYAAVFTVYGEQAVGRLSVRRGVPDASQVAQISVPLTLPSIFRATVESKGYYFGPIYDEGINFGVLADLERPVPASAFIMPVLIRNRVVCFVYADHGLHPVAAEVPESLVFISYQVSQAFQRLILRSKRERYSGATDARDASGKVSLRPEVNRGPTESGSWQATSAAPEPAPSRAPQHEGVFADPTAPGVSSAVQPAFPALSAPLGVAPMTVPAGSSTEPPSAEPPSAEPPSAEPPMKEVALSSEAPGARAITSVGYYSLSEPHLDEDVRGSTASGRPIHDGIAAGELETSPPGTPHAIQSDESPVRVDRSLAAQDDSESRAEDIWSLIDDLEQGGLEGDLAGAALQRLGDPALKLVAFRFPGRLSQDRMGQHGKLPPPSAHGPLLNFLVRVGDPAIPHLLGLLDSENPEVRYYATYVFSELRAPAVVPQLLDRVFDSAPPVRRIVVEVFKRYSGTAELDAVLEHLRAELVGPVPFRTRCATEVLGTLRDVPAVPRLIELACDRDPETAETAQRALLLITKQAFGDSRRKWRSWWDKNQDRNRLLWLIDALGHKESECRFLASQELHRLTGETFGYRFDQDRRDRDDAQRRWHSWWTERGQKRFSKP